jgi:hypothetical protein
MSEYTDIDAWNAETQAFLTKIGQVEKAEPKPTSKKEEA